MTTRTATQKVQATKNHDEGMRAGAALTIGETFAATGFPPDYKLPSGITRGTALTMGGNAVAPPVGRWLVERVAEAA